MQKRKTQFVEDSIKALKQLEREWFPPGNKSPEGYYYGCGYCDMECGGHERHDKDCLPQMAKNTLAEIMIIQIDPSYEYDWKNNLRKPEETQEVRYYQICDILVEKFYKPILNHLIPLDYEDPANKSIVCICYHQYQFKTKSRRAKHHEHCIYQTLASIWSNFFKVK